MRSATGRDAERAASTASTSTSWACATTWPASTATSARCAARWRRSRSAGRRRHARGSHQGSSSEVRARPVRSRRHLKSLADAESRQQFTLLTFRGSRSGSTGAGSSSCSWSSGCCRATTGTCSATPQDSIEPYALAVISAFALLRLDPAPRARATRSSRCATRSASPQITLWMFGGDRRAEADSRHRRRRVPDRRRRPGRHARDRGRCCLRGRPASTRPSLLGGDATSTSGADVSPAVAVLAWIGNINAADPPLQPAPRLPARRRPDRPGDRLADHRRPRAGDATSPPASARASRSSSSRSESSCFVQRRRLQRHLAGADRLDARPVGAGDRRPQRAEPAASAASRSPT